MKMDVLTADKWGCPKMRYQKGQWLCECKEPCSPAKKGRTTYTYENMAFRMFPGIQRDSNAWIELYKIRAVVEKAINHFKNNMCIARKKKPESPYYESGCLLSRHCQPVYGYPCRPFELSTIHTEYKTFNCIIIKAIVTQFVLAY